MKISKYIYEVDDDIYDVVVVVIRLMMIKLRMED